MSTFKKLAVATAALSFSAVSMASDIDRKDNLQVQGAVAPISNIEVVAYNKATNLNMESVTPQNVGSITMNNNMPDGFFVTAKSTNKGLESGDRVVPYTLSIQHLSQEDNINYAGLERDYDSSSGWKEAIISVFKSANFRNEATQELKYGLYLELDEAQTISGVYRDRIEFEMSDM